MQLKINIEYESLLPKLTEAEFEELKESIRKDGLHYALAINKDGTILDGHHRFRACKELGIEPRVEVKEFENALLEKKFVIESNLKRRHLNKFQRARLVLPLLEIEKEIARERQWHINSDGSAQNCAESTKKQHKPLTEEQKQKRRIKLKEKRDRQKALGILPKKPKRATTVVAKKAQIGERTLEKAKAIMESGTAEIQQRVENNEMSIDYAYKMVKRRNEEQNFEPLPEGEFNVIYADPPWRYDLPFAGSPDSHYVTKTTEEICKLQVASSQDAILFLWATNPCLEDALTVMKAWGFQYKTNIVWVKDRVGTGYWVRGQHELLLIGIKGNFHPPLEEKRCSSVINAPRTNHSKKPEVVYEIIEKMFPNQKYLELFARVKREKWATWGLEIEGKN